LKKFIIIDGHSLLYRAYFALIRNPLYNSSGLNTSALFGFLNMFFRIIDDFSPDRLVVVQDKVRGGYRKELFKDYKANRSATPDDLKKQFPVFEKLLMSAGIPVLSHPDYEGDDIIGSLAVKYSGEPDQNMYIITGDRDMFQLLDVSDRLKVVLTRKGVSKIDIYDSEKFTREFGITPDKVIDHKALTGDRSDNIPGVRGIGPRTADKLIKRYSDLETLYENIDDLKGALRKKLEEDKELAFISRKLATIQTDMEIVLDKGEICFNPDFSEEFFEILSELEFTKFLDRFNIKPKKIEKEKIPLDYRVVDSEEQFEGLVKELEKVEDVCIDTETTSSDIEKLRLVGISISYQPYQAFYIPLGHIYPETSKQLEAEKILPVLSRILERKKVIGHNLKFDLMVLRKYGVNLKPGFDTSIAHYLIDSEATSHSLKKLSQRYLDEQMVSFDEVVKDNSDLSCIEISIVKDYSCADADHTFRLYKIFQEKLNKQGLEKVFFEVELPLINVLEKMEAAGIEINNDYLKKLEHEFLRNTAGIKQEMFKLSGQEFNPDSPKQLSEILFEVMGIPPVKKTKTGYSTNARVLEKLSVQGYEIARLIKRYRLYNKLLSTYIRPLPLLTDSESRIHTSFNQTVARTGRLSSSNPNLQNIPVREEEGRAIRKAFVASEGKMLISFDYSQIELRVLAHLSRDPILVKAFRDGDDIHSITAANIFGKDQSEVTSEERSTAKMVNFGVVYGMNAYGLSSRLGMSVKEAELFIDTFFEKYSGVGRYVDEMIEKGKKEKFSYTILGRKRRLPSNKNLLYRLAVNNPVQGSAADIIKLAMKEVDAFLDKRKYHAQMLLQIHDELIFEISLEEDRKSFVKKITDIMENVFKIEVPLVVNFSEGKDWGKLK